VRSEFCRKAGGVVFPQKAVARARAAVPVEAPAAAVVVSPAVAARSPVSTVDWLQTRSSGALKSLSAVLQEKAQRRRRLGDVVQDIFVDRGDNRALSPETLMTLVFIARPRCGSAAFAHLIESLCSVIPDFSNPVTRTDLRERLRQVLVAVAQQPKLLKVCNGMALEMYESEAARAGKLSVADVGEAFDRMEIEVLWKRESAQAGRAEKELGWLQIGVGLHRRALLDREVARLLEGRPAGSEGELRMALRNAVRGVVAGGSIQARGEAAVLAVQPTDQEVAQVLHVLVEADVLMPDPIKKRCEFLADWPRWRAQLEKKHAAKFEAVLCLFGQQGVPPGLQTRECREAIQACAVKLTRKAWDKRDMAEFLVPSTNTQAPP
jgi:hypothetical protein